MAQVKRNTVQSYHLIDRDIMFDAQGEYVLRVKDLPDSERPREKLIAAGPDTLSIAELVAVIWGTGTRSEEVFVMAGRTVCEYGEAALVSEKSPTRLAESVNIPLVKACQLVASFELGRRYHDTKRGEPVQIRTAEQAYHYVRAMAGLQKEQLRGLYLNSRHVLIHDEVLSVGSLTANIVHPREVFQPAIERGAVAIIIAHNHPSGSLEATVSDIEATTQLVAAGEVLGIDILDHLVVSGAGYKSIIRERSVKS